MSQENEQWRGWRSRRQECCHRSPKNLGAKLVLNWCSLWKKETNKGMSLHYTRIDWKMESLDLKLPLLSKQYDSCFLTERLIFVTTINGLLPFMFRSFEDPYQSDQHGNEDSYTHDTVDDTNSKKPYSFVGLIYPNLIQENCE